MELHYFHANMTLEMVYCSAGIWESNVFDSII